MKHLVRVIGIAVLFSLFGTTSPAYAQEEHQDQAKPKQDEQQKQKEPQAKAEERAQQKQSAQQAKTEERAQQKQEAQQAKSSQHAQQNQRASNNSGGRIPDDRFRAHFGREHHFRINRLTIVSGSPRFQYGGYWFGFGEPWPVGWQYTDEVYVDYIGGVYYLLSPVHPGVQISINVIL
jgi:flagellar motor protein MotB